MAFDLLLHLVERMSVVVTISFLLTRWPFTRRFLQRKGTHLQRVVMALIFGVLGIMGTYTGIPIQGALANSRAIAPLVGGLLGGPLVGLAAGLIAGVHRFAIGGFTALSCGLSTTVEGLIGGLISRRVKEQEIPWSVAFWTGVIAEVAQMGIILTFSRPFPAAWDLVKAIAAPMILVNAAGVAIFMVIVQAVFSEEERAGALEAQKVLRIANRTLPFLRQGLHADSARATAEIIYGMTDVAAVAITDQDKILACVGDGSDHHYAGLPIQTEATRLALATGKLQLAQNRKEIGCDVHGCPLMSAVVVPLQRRNEVIGTLKLYRSEERGIGPLDIELAEGLGQLFSTQVELADLEMADRLRSKAELKALQAQINPHFLFNALNTISSFCRRDPETARTLLGHLADSFRRSLQEPGTMVTLEQELEHVHAYLSLEQARFGDKLVFAVDIDPRLKTWQLPALTLQPLVENAVRHGLLPRKTGGRLVLTGRLEQGEACLTVEDNGVGMTGEELRRAMDGESDTPGGLGMGLSNVNLRLVSIYGPQYGLAVTSRKGRGTKVEVRIPAEVQEAIL